MFYRYIPESDTYELVGYVHSEDKWPLESNGKSNQYPDEADTSETGTVYYVGTDGWGTDPMDETDYMEWLNANEGKKDLYKVGAETLNLFQWSGWRPKTHSNCKIMVYDK